MGNLKVKIKKLHEDAKIPAYSKKGDAGMDLSCVSWQNVGENHVKYNFGLSFEIPEGHVGLIFPRSSIYKHNQILSNSVGVVDSGYRGEVSAVMYTKDAFLQYKKGDRCAQLIIMPFPKVEFEVSDELTETERGEGGFGSTGNN